MEVETAAASLFRLEKQLGLERTTFDIAITLSGPAIGAGTLARIEAELDDLLPWMIGLSRLADLSQGAAGLPPLR